MRIRFSKPQRKQKYLENKTSSYLSKQEIHPLPRIAIEVEILYQALYVLSTTLEHEFDEMSNSVTTDRMSGEFSRREFFH